MSVSVSVSVFLNTAGIGIGIGIFAHCPTVLFSERERFSHAIVCLSSVTFVHPTQVIDIEL